MAIAETARLVASLELQDKLTGPALKAAGTIGTLDRGVSNLSRRGISVLQRGFGLASTAAGRFGAALSTARSRIVGLLTGPLGMLGLGAGLFSLGGLFKSGIEKARDFGAVVLRLAQLTGLSVETTSRLAGAFEHFGIEADSVKSIVGLAEKNLGLLTATTTKHGKVISGAAAFHKKFGLSLVDSSGHAKNFNTLLLDSADFFNNKSIPAQTKAAALSKLYGRGWQDLIPILSSGRKGISDAEDEAARLGVTLTKDNIVALGKAKAATRTWNEALGGLKLQIGLAVLPALTDLTKAVTTLVVDNRTRIVAFVRGIIDGARTLAGAFTTSVLPALKDVAAIIRTMFRGTGGVSFTTILHESANFAKDLGSAINSFVVPAIKGIVKAWDGLPDDLRTLLVKGFITNKALKWTFGFDAVGFGVKMASSFIANAAGKLTADLTGSLLAAGVGKAFIQPVFVTNPGFGLPGGGGSPAIPLGPGAGTAPLLLGLGAAPLALGAITVGAITAGAIFAANAPPESLINRPGGHVGPGDLPRRIAEVAGRTTVPPITKRDADGIRSGLDDVTQQTKKVWASQEENRRALIEAGTQTLTANGEVKKAVIAAAQEGKRGSDGIRSEVREKDLSVTVPVNVSQTTYFNGRIVNANLARYNSTTPARRPG